MKFSGRPSSPMGSRTTSSMSSSFIYLLLSTVLPARAFAGAILTTNGFATCSSDATVQVDTLDITFNSNTNVVTFDAAGSSDEVQYVLANLQVSAYGKSVYNRTFDPCDESTHVQQLCPVPKGTFAAIGNETVPAKYASQIPGIAYHIPDLEAEGILSLISANTSRTVACIQSTVGNGRTAKTKGATYAAVAIAAGALAVSGVTAVAGVASAGGIGHAGSSSSPGFIETIHWFQSVAMNGMLSVQYPAVYRSFSQNFGFSAGLISWKGMQISIDNFRAATGGNLTDDSVQYLEKSTIVYTSDGTSNGTIASRSLVERGLNVARAIVSSVNGTTSIMGGPSGTSSSAASASSLAAPAPRENFVTGIKGYVNELTIPQSNTFMTVLLVFAVVLAAVTASILLFKVILEIWALFASFPKKLTSFRKNYWWLVAKTVTNLILLLYGVWTLYCIYQFTKGDSWAAKLLAAVTLAAFTLLLVGFTLVIWHKAHQYTDADASTSILHGDKETWQKYKIFYGDYKKSFWWIFIPTIVYMFAKGVVIAAGDGHGLVQTGGQLILDGLMLLMLLFLRPYNMRSGNWINIFIQVVRVLSVLCILVFVEQFGIDQTTQTVVGLVLIIVQVVLSAILAILICINSLIYCFKTNPHRQKRKAAERLRDADLTPMDARNSLLMYPLDTKAPITTSESYTPPPAYGRGYGEKAYTDVTSRAATPLSDYPNASHDRLVNSSPIGMAITTRSRNNSFDSLQHAHREPQLPDVEYRGMAI